MSDSSKKRCYIKSQTYPHKPLRKWLLTLLKRSKLPLKRENDARNGIERVNTQDLECPFTSPGNAPIPSPDENSYHVSQVYIKETPNQRRDFSSRVRLVDRYSPMPKHNLFLLMRPLKNH